MKVSYDDHLILKFNISRDYIFYPAQFWAHKNHTYILQGMKILKDEFNIIIDVVFVRGCSVRRRIARGRATRGRIARR